jgi:hypothetical protein
MKKPSETDLANVQNYLIWKGHACPNIIGDEVHFINQTRGTHRIADSAKIADILEEISLLKTVESDYYSDKSAFSAGSIRVGVGNYQIMEAKGKLYYREDLPIILRGQF